MKRKIEKSTYWPWLVVCGGLLTDLGCGRRTRSGMFGRVVYELNK